MCNVIQTLAVKSVIVFALVMSAWINAAVAQPFTLASQHLRDAEVAPLPAVLHPRTGRMLVGVRGDVRRMEQTATGGLIDRGSVHTAPGSTVLRVRLDVRRDRLWVLDIGRVHVVDLATSRRIRTIALRNWMFSAHEDLCLPDLQLDEHGAAFVSDNVQAKLWRIDGEDFSIYERSVKLDSHANIDSGFSALTIGEGGVMFAAMAAPGLLWRIDTDVYRAENVPLSARIFGACALETARTARSREFTLFALSVRDRYEVRRVTLVRGSTAAAVTTLPTGSTTARSSLLTSNGALYLATHESGGARRPVRAADVTLKPIYREE